MARHSALFLAFALMAPARPALAQHTTDNAVTAAEDAFGTVIGREQIGIYNDGSVRGFSPQTAGNFRIEGMYYDIEAGFSDLLIDGETIRVGPSAQGYAFPAPTGIADLQLKNSGEHFTFSPLISMNTLGGINADLNAAVPLGKGLSTALGLSAYHYRYINGGGAKQWNIAAVPRWHPRKGVEVIGFFAHSSAYGDTSDGIYVPSGDFLPPPVHRAIYPGPSFATTNHSELNAGLVARAALGAWSLRAGLFRSRFSQGTGYTNIIAAGPDGGSRRSVNIYPGNTNASWSGEIRATRRISDGPRRHHLTVSLRARDISARYGDGPTIDLGAVPLEAVIDAPKPQAALGPLTDNRTHQAVLGLSYKLEWQGLGEVTLGAQRSRYIKAISTPGAPFIHDTTNVWLPSVSGAVHLGKGLTAYGSFVKGLEDAGTAPGFANNANQLLPAVRSRQWDAGIKWSPSKQATLILGYYLVSKPYFNLDHAGDYGVLGAETHRGVEISFTGTLASGLTVVAGGFVARPRVTAANVGEYVGPRPVGQVDTSLQVNLDYELPFLKGVALDTTINHTSSVAGTVNNAVIIPGYTQIDLGARYRFALGGKPWTLRVSAFNVTDVFRYVAIGGGAYDYNTPRRVRVYLTTDI